MTTTALEPIDTDLWGTEHDHYMYGFVHFRGRMTVMRLEDGSLLLHSPIPIDDALAKDLAALGPVKHLVAPNRLHHVHLASVRERYKDATLWGAPGLPDKRRDLTFDAVLGQTPAPWDGQVDMLRLDGNPWIGEVVFLHRASRTLVVTDLVFNIQRAANVWTRMILRSVGAYQQLAQSRLWRMTTKDRAAIGESVERMLAWRFDRVSMAHGEIIDRDPQERLRDALRWMLGRKALTAPTAA